MQQARYKVETFIIPEGNQCHKEINTNEEDDIKIANRLKERDERIEVWSTEILKSTNIEEHRSSVAQLECCAMLQKDCQELCTLNNIIVSQMQMRRFNSLTSIDEKLEDNGAKCTNLCYHGYENGCTVPAPSPQQISEDIFQANWLSRLEILRCREAALNDREIALQCRERSMFEKEKELRILERQLKNKLKQVDQYSKNIKHLQSMNSKDNEYVTESRSSSESSGSQSRSTLSSTNSKSSNVASGLHNKGNLHSTDSKSHAVPKIPGKISSNMCEHIQENPHHNVLREKRLHDQKEPNDEIKHNEHQAFAVNNVGMKQMGTTHISRSTLLNQPSVTTVSNMSKFQCSSNLRTKQRPKMSYDDLDSTLSADIGDISFIQTSKKFNPAHYRKPFAFTRSASERRPRHVSNKDSVNMLVQNVNALKENPLSSGVLEGNKILKRVTDNISASHNGCTTFQDYGLIDQQSISSENQSKSDVLCNSAQYKKAKAPKERPISWSAETNEWLQKKREAYNLTTKIVTEDVDSKENLKCSIKVDGMDNSSKKKDVKRKMFTIFR